MRSKLKLESVQKKHAASVGICFRLVLLAFSCSGALLQDSYVTSSTHVPQVLPDPSSSSPRHLIQNYSVMMLLQIKVAVSPMDMYRVYELRIPRYFLLIRKFFRNVETFFDSGLLNKIYFKNIINIVENNNKERGVPRKYV